MMLKRTGVRLVTVFIAAVFVVTAVGCGDDGAPEQDATPDSSGILACESDDLSDCMPGRLAGNALYNMFEHSDYVVLANLEMDFDSPGPIASDKGEAETADFTTLVITKVNRIYRNRVDEPSSVFFPGVCSQTGECTQQPGSFPVKLKRGLNLLLASRYCGNAGLTKTILVANAAFPVEGDVIYDVFGNQAKWSDLESQIEPLSGKDESLVTCPAD